MSGAFLLMFATGWSLFVLIFDVVIVGITVQQYQSRDYVSTAGTVTLSEVVQKTGSKGHVSYTPHIAYRYELGGSHYFSERVRFGNVPSDSGSASAMVAAHGVGTAVTVYYDPKNPAKSLLLPGIEGADLIGLLFLTPFNAAAIVLCGVSGGWLRERTIHPLAGGVKIIRAGMTTRARLPHYPPWMWGVATTGLLGFVFVFIVLIGTQGQPSLSQMAGALAVVYLGGFGIYSWQWWKRSTGIFDLVIDANARTVTLPLTFGRKEPLTARWAEITGLIVLTIPHRGSKGGTSYTYAPTLAIQRVDQQLADWSDEMRAQDFVEWLRKELGI